jgi:hypothetical protein
LAGGRGPGQLAGGTRGWADLMASWWVVVVGPVGGWSCQASGGRDGRGWADLMASWRPYPAMGYNMAMHWPHATKLRSVHHSMSLARLDVFIGPPRADWGRKPTGQVWRERERERDVRPLGGDIIYFGRAHPMATARFWSDRKPPPITSQTP